MKTSFKMKFLFAMLMSFAATEVLAHEGDDFHSGVTGPADAAVKPHVFGTKSFKNSKGGDLFVVIQRVENVMGTPYQVELRGSCEATKYSSAEQAPVMNVQNYCDVKVSSPELAGENLSFMMREVDAEKFNARTRDIEDPEALLKVRPTCLKKGVKEIWSVKDFCAGGAAHAVED